MPRRLFSALLAACILVSRPSAAQIVMVEPSGPRPVSAWMFDVGGVMAQPIGDFKTQVDRAWGVGGSVRHHFRRAPALGIRADAAWLNYGNENKSVPLSPTVNRVIVDMHTMNNIALVTAGPELIVPRGPIRPYAYAFAGFSYFYTQSSASGDDNSGTFASSTNFDDGGLATGWGGGVRVPMLFKTVEAALDLGGRLTRNGVRSYLTRGDIIDQPDGSLLFNSRRTAADFWEFHVGLSFAPRSK